MTRFIICECRACGVCVCVFVRAPVRVHKRFHLVVIITFMKRVLARSIAGVAHSYFLVVLAHLYASNVHMVLEIVRVFVFLRE